MKIPQCIFDRFSGYFFGEGESAFVSPRAEKNKQKVILFRN